jgi:peptide/nickel transport system ATP-binding protein
MGSRPTLHRLTVGSGVTHPILTIQNLSVIYEARGGAISAVDRVSFGLGRGESLGIVGESGSGKTTLALAVLRLLPENARVEGGRVIFEGADLLALTEREMRAYRRGRIATIFQAAMNALTPVIAVGEQIEEALRLCERGPDAARQTAALLEAVGLEADAARRYPHELSGGMRQRVVIAMALACDPDLIVADEPTTALDVLVQHRVLGRLRAIRAEHGMSLIAISHDIAVIGEISDRIGVMYAGQLAEIGPADAVLERPRHPYTRALLDAVPSVRGPKKPPRALPGEPPDLAAPPTGCRFHPRCPRATGICAEAFPAYTDHGPRHRAACWHPVEYGVEGGGE